MNKIVNLSQATAIINDGDMVAIGGNVLHRVPMAMVREIIRQKKKNLKIIKTAGAMDVDMLCLAGCVYSIDAGFISYETEFGLANNFRKSVQNGIVKANEHACYTVICALRAASIGAPFMPVKGLKYGDLLNFNDNFKVINDPFSGESITVVKALCPDVAIIHVQEADEQGNGRIIGPKFEDILMSRAASKVILTAEKIVSSNTMLSNPQHIDIPGFLVSAVVLAPGGATPGSCPSYYDIDKDSIKAFKKITSHEELNSYLNSYERKDRRGDNIRIGDRY